MKKILKVSEIIDIYNILSNIDYFNLNVEDRIKIWKIVQNFKSYVDSYEKNILGLYDSIFTKEFLIDSGKADNYKEKKSRGETENLPMTEEEYNNFIKLSEDYNKLASSNKLKLLSVGYLIDIDPISADSVSQLIENNEYSPFYLYLLNSLTKG